MNDMNQIVRRLKQLASPEIAAHSQRFFKTGKGEYGEGDQFLGIRVPVLRAEVKKQRDLPLDETVKLLSSKLHEVRLFALLMMVEKFEKSDEKLKGNIYQHYMDNLSHINNWDLIDLSAPKIVGAWLADKDKSMLYKLAKSDNLWQRRIAVLATFQLIKNNDFQDAVAIAERLVNDKHDLIHKAVGWMLREIGKRNLQCEEQFLNKHYKTMPRTMLRYAIERFPEQKRKAYLNGSI